MSNAEPLVLRRDILPSRSTVVVRGGTMPRASVEASAAANHDDYGFYGVSVFAREGVEPADLWSSTDEIAPPKYKKIRTTTVGALLDAGFQLLPTWDEPHFDIVLADLTDLTWEALEGVFSAPTSEPG